MGSSSVAATLINLYSNECTQGLRYYEFALNLDKCVGSFKILLMTYLM